ncbi:hypothetical protein BZA05DRAFT_407415 [Tricharina praecox]|uniref:uncharacterized protein n=1 Tax=Tricharina praecox TaxID=43433 RepID=UPI00221F075D|nr:uncharacterized protein BZA05DRAFT_407415 [Tricharina praecox]KAI5845949.1 hypothetical protein BZA05DRAFT_407415 [Tricharina praecox]
MNALPICEPCNLIFPHRAALWEHRIAAQHLRCNLCNTYVVDPSQLSLHLQLFHTDLRHRYCFECAWVFADAEALNCHLQWSPRHRSQRLQYALAPAVVSVQQTMQGYRKEKQHHCTECERYFVNAAGLKSHLASSLRHRRPGSQSTAAKTGRLMVTNIPCAVPDREREIPQSQAKVTRTQRVQLPHCAQQNAVPATAAVKSAQTPTSVSRHQRPGPALAYRTRTTRKPRPSANLLPQPARNTIKPSRPTAQQPTPEPIIPYRNTWLWSI